MKVAQESSLTVVVKKKEATEKAPQKVVITAFIEYPDPEQTMNEFEKMRDFLVNKGDTKAVLFFHNEENNSYLSLFTPGLAKPANLSEKQFEQKLLNDFRKINKNVIQVNIYHVRFNDTYIGRVYLRTENDGKDFIIDYSSKRKDIYENYRENSIIFNINVDTKTLRKIKQAEKKAQETEDKIKKQSEANRRETRGRPPNTFPVTGMPPIPIGLGPNLVMPSIPGGMAPPGLGGLGPMGPPPMGPMGGFTGPMGMKPPVMMGQNVPGFGQNPTEGMRGRIKHILKDKANFINSNPDTAKRLLSEPLKFLIE